jgi:hypothetical protein
VAYLNHIVATDPSVIEGLLPQAGEPATDELPADSPARMSVVSVINSILELADSREYIGQIEDEAGCFVGFQSVPADVVERASRRE